MNELVFADVRSGSRHDVTVTRLIVVGFTGRDGTAVQAHITELAEMGVPVPTTTPVHFPLEPSLVVQTDTLEVSGDETSGEVEPVLVISGGQQLLAVGSDHTDRRLERSDIAASKAACAKVVGRSCIPVDSIDAWDDIEVTSWIDGDVLYQEGTLKSLLPAAKIVAYLATQDIRLSEGDVVFLGTVPVRGEIRPAASFRGTLRVPGLAEPLTVAYAIYQGDRPAEEQL